MPEKQGEQLESIWGGHYQKDTKWGSRIKSKEEEKAYNETEWVGVNSGRIQKPEEGVCTLKCWETI